MKVAVTGASGFVGRAVVEALQRRGDEVIALGREPERLAPPPGVDCRRFDPSEERPQPAAFEGAEAVIHLAGESVAGRWTAERKRAIRSSRVEGTRTLVRSLEQLASRPAVLACASAIGYYGPREDEPLLEDAAPGRDFLASVCVEWEAAAHEAELLGIATACLRTGIVLGRGGALDAMKPIFRLGVGGPMGSGRQFVPWIHIDDLVALYLFAVDGKVRGAVNAVTPDYATSARFAQALGAAMRRTAIVPAPAAALRLAVGEFANTLLASQLVMPARAQDAGFVWRHPLLETAVAHAIGSTHALDVNVFETAQTVHAPLREVFAFFSSPRNLERITPPTLRFAFKSVPASIERGATISYKLHVHGFPMHWDTLISRWEPERMFEDVQLHGPYALWRHTHSFEERPDGVELLDRVEYALPLAPFGNAVKPLVDRDVASIFAYRRRVIEELFGNVRAR